MVKYIDKGTARQHLTDRLMECALNNVGVKADADEVFRDIAENRLPVWIDELQTYDVQEVKHGWWEHLGGDEWFCTACAHVITTEGSWERPWQKYCEECGAKMDEVLTQNR